MDTLLAFVWLGAVLVAVGLFGYFSEKRKHGPEGVRRFLILYGFSWPMFATAIPGLLYPRLHWLLYVSFAICVLCYVVQILDLRRTRMQMLMRKRMRSSAQADTDKP